MSTTFEGGCFCGAVRYRIRDPFGAVYCHCRMCQRVHAAPVVAWVAAPAGGLEIIAGTPRVLASSERGERIFCGTCGTHISCRHADDQWSVSVTLATLDDPASIVPVAHIWTASRLPWFDTRDELPRREDGPFPAAVDASMK